ncbi:MAG: hypothetical protein ACPGTP_07235 [Bacteroidia bacterium]
MPDELKENSGLAFYGSGILYFINDGGNAPLLYRYDTLSSSLTSKSIVNANNADWEDLAQDDDGVLYIGDIGNNGNSRKNLRIFISPNPENVFGTELTVDTISFRYQNQTEFPPNSSNLNYDCEAMIHYKDSLYLFTKNRTDPYDGWSYMYVLPDRKGDYVARLSDSIQFPAVAKENGWITGADVRGDSLVLLSSSKVHIAGSFMSKPLKDLKWTEYNVGFSQKEAVVYGATNEQVFLSDELFVIGNNLYFLDISTDLSRVEILEVNQVKIKSSCNKLEIRLPKSQSECMIRITDMLGKFSQTSFSEGTMVLEGDLWPNQVYIVQVFCDGKYTAYRWAKTQ